MMGLWAAIYAPLQGKTSLGKVVWGYGLLGSILLSAVGLFIDSGNVIATRLYDVFGFIYSVYVTVATYQCARNCGSRFVAGFVRICAVISLVLLPLLAYWEFTGAFDRAIATWVGDL
jgi:hypothetical protein